MKIEPDLDTGLTKDEKEELAKPLPEVPLENPKCLFEIRVSIVGGKRIDCSIFAKSLTEAKAKAKCICDEILIQEIESVTCHYFTENWDCPRCHQITECNYQQY